MRPDIYVRDIGKYRKEKVQVLEDFRIFLSDEEMLQMGELTTETAIDIFARQMISTKTCAIGKGKDLRMVSKEEYARIKAAERGA